MHTWGLLFCLPIMLFQHCPSAFQQILATIITKSLYASNATSVENATIFHAHFMYPLLILSQISFHTQIIKRLPTPWACCLSKKKSFKLPNTCWLTKENYNI
jgi:hypothetical protein